MSRLREERGGILVLSAVMIPVFLLLTAMVIDVGNWYTHKRQLQNRADAAAFSAGLEYGKHWKACVQTSNAALKASTATEIADAARTYAADPEASDYAGSVVPSALYNNEIANQAQLDVMINSPDYTNDNDYNDYGGTLKLGNPCYLHPGDDISAAGYWTDVKVKERDLPSLFGGFGLPLARNIARARVDVRPALSGHRFLPLAIPNNVITKVQIRYYDECRNHTLISTQDLAPLPAVDQAAYAGAGGGTLWALPSAGDPSVGDRNRSFNLSLPSYGGCSQPYLPVGVEVRLASRDEVDLNQSCSALVTAPYADCFSRLSQIRVYNDGNADSQPRITNVRLTGGCPNADAYFGPLASNSIDCRYAVAADVDWGTRDDGNKNVPANFQVTANGVALTLTSPTSQQSGVYTSAGSALIATAGANDLTISLNWTDTNPSHSWGGTSCRPGGQNTCTYSGSELVHRAYVGTKATAGAVALVRSSSSTFVSGLPGPPLDNVADGGTVVPIFPTIGIKSVLKTGVLTTLRLDDPQANQTVQCDPLFANQGQEFATFRYGCSPWYAGNTFANGPWWDTSTRKCPPSNLWFGTGNMGAPYGQNSSTNPWRCLQTAPGLSTPVIGEGLSVATGNCANINSNSCQRTACLVDGNYDGKSGSPNGWLQRGGDSRDPRVINLFIVPYQALKGVGGGNPDQVIPVLGFASFYVMNWTGSNSGNSDPCPDPDLGSVSVSAPPGGGAVGVFVETVDYEPGPVDSTATCTEGQLTPCRVTLVR